MDVDRLTPAQLKTYQRGLFASHERKVELDVLNLEGDHLDRLTLKILDGQVSATRGSADTVSRVLTVRSAGRKNVLDFGPSSPGEGLYFSRMIRVHDSRHVDGLGWVTATPFTGPIWSFRRVGSEVEFTAHSKDRLAMGTLWTPLTLRKGIQKVDAIRTILEVVGEDRFDLPSIDARLPERRSLDRFASPWSHAQRIARSMNRQLYYDGRGVCRLRRLPGKPGFTFRSGDGGGVLSDPEVERSLDDARNVVLVLGRKPKGSRDRPRAVVRAPEDHPLRASAGEGLGRNGAPRYLAEKIENNALRSNRECQEYGEQIIRDRLRGIVDASFDAAPVPHLDPGDLCRLVLDDGAIDFRLWDFSLPLTPDVMSVGEVRRTTRARRRHR